MFHWHTHTHTVTVRPVRSTTWSSWSRIWRGSSRSRRWRRCGCRPTPCWPPCWAPNTECPRTWGRTWSRSRRRWRRRWAPQTSFKIHLSCVLYSIPQTQNDVRVWNWSSCLYFRRSKPATGGRTSKTRPGWTAGRRCSRQRPELQRVVHPYQHRSCLCIVCTAHCLQFV